MADNHDSGGLYGKVAAKMGAGARAGATKIYHSKTGRLASQEALKGATNAAAKDLSNRFVRRGEDSSNSTPAPAAAPTTNSTSSSVPSKSTHHEERPSPESYEEARRYNPPKPSISDHYTNVPHFNTKKSSKPASARPKPRQQPRQPGERRTYKHRLAKEPNWDKEAQALTLYNYQARMKCDLEFCKGQVISIVYRTDDQNDWWEGRLDGKLGIFPANYVRLL